MKVLLTGNTCFKIANFRSGLIRALLAKGCEVQVLAPADKYEERLTNMGCRVTNLTMDRNGTSPFAEMLLIGRVWDFLRQERPDFVFSYTIKNNIYAGICCRWLDIPFIPNVTGLGPAFNERGWLNQGVINLYRFAFSKARVVFFQNANDQATFLRSGIVEERRTWLLPGSGVDLSKFNAQPMPDKPNQVSFLLVSRLLWDKGVGLFAEAARILRTDYPNLRFQILGPPDPDSHSGVEIDQIIEWQREGIIEYLGDTDDVRPMIAAADCIVLPTWYREGMPRVLLEAAAIGRPVITTDTPGCSDTVQDGRTGFLCAPRDRHSLIGAVRAFANMNKSDRVAMGHAARQLAETAFDEQRVISAYLDQLTKRP